MSQSVSLSFRVSPEKAAELQSLAETTDRSKSWLLEQALERYLEEQAWQLAKIDEGLADLEAGRVIEHERVVAWLKSWGKPDELDPPT